MGILHMPVLQIDVQVNIPAASLSAQVVQKGVQTKLPLHPCPMEVRHLNLPYLIQILAVQDSQLS